MEDNNIVGLVEAKKELTSKLIDVLRPHMHSGIKSLYESAVKVSLENDGNNDSLFVFQNKLTSIPQWSQQIITEEYERIQEDSGCDWLDKLITTTLASHAKILTIVNNRNKSNKEIIVKIPKPEFFLHKCYIQAARQFWKYPYLFSNKVNRHEYQQNMRDSENIIAESINETIRVQLPFKHFLQESLQDDYESDEEERVDKSMSSSQQNNLRKLVKRELDSLRKQNLSKDALKNLVMDELDKLNISDDEKEEKTDEIIEELTNKEEVKSTEDVKDEVKTNKKDTHDIDEESKSEPIETVSQSKKEPKKEPKKDHKTESIKESDKVKEYVKEDVKEDIKEDVKETVKEDIKKDVKEELDIVEDVKEESTPPDVKEEIKSETVEESKPNEVVEEVVTDTKLSEIKDALQDELNKLEESEKPEKQSNDMTFDDLMELDELTNIDDLKPANIFGESSPSLLAPPTSPISFPEAPDFLSEDNTIVEDFITEPIIELPKSEPVVKTPKPINKPEPEKEELESVKTIHLDKLTDKTKSKIKTETATPKEESNPFGDLDGYIQLGETDGEISESELPISDIEDDLDLGLEDLENNVVSFGTGNNKKSSSKTEFNFFKDAKDDE